MNFYILGDKVVKAKKKKKIVFLNILQTFLSIGPHGFMNLSSLILYQ